MEELQKVIDVVDDVLGAECIGAYLHGSSVAGGLKPASDLDVLLLVRRTMTQSERVALLDGVLNVSGSRNNARPVELTVVVHSQIRPWRFPPIADFVYGEWLRADYEAGHIPLPECMPDLALLITMALAGDRPLSGPRPAQVLPAVPHSDVVRASLAGISELVNSLDEDTRNVVLTLARIWCTVATGQIRSKDAAANWALAHLPPEHHASLEHARDLYRGSSYDDENWSDPLREAVRPLTDHILAAIDELRCSSPRHD